jgi:hypothetical protein
MIALLIITIVAIWIALGLACALRVGRRRRTGASRMADDPFFFPFGEMPTVPSHFVMERRHRLVMTCSNPPAIGVDMSRRIFFPIPSAGLALRPDAGSDEPFVPSGPVAARNLLRGPRHG